MEVSQWIRKVVYYFIFLFFFFCFILFLFSCMDSELHMILDLLCLWIYCRFEGELTHVSRRLGSAGRDHGWSQEAGGCGLQSGQPMSFHSYTYPEHKSSDASGVSSKTTSCEWHHDLVVLTVLFVQQCQINGPLCNKSEFSLFYLT